MKVLLESIDGTQFPVEVGESTGTLQEMKVKVEKALLIPRAKQVLFFDGKILRQDSDLVNVKNGSVIEFRSIVPAPAPEPEPEVKDLMRLQVHISATETITVTTSGGDTLYELKEKIQEKVGIPPDRILLTTSEDGTELADHKRVRDCDWESGVELEFLSTAPAVDEDMLRLELQFKGEKLPAPVVVRKGEMVKELRKKVDEMEFKVAGNVDYCFFRGEDLLDENSSFASHKIANGDVIRITTGYACSLRRYVG